MRHWQPSTTTCTYTPTVPAIDRVASLIREGHTLTTSTAWTEHGITALPSVIARLKAKGWKITIRRVGTVNSVVDNVTLGMIARTLRTSSKFQRPPFPRSFDVYELSLTFMEVDVLIYARVPR